MAPKIQIHHGITSRADLSRVAADVMDSCTSLLPDSGNALILIKPNLNSNMNALTGNTTDLRLLAAVILELKHRGFTNILIGEGTNSGFYRNRIGVISRLKIDALARWAGVSIKDLNYADPVPIRFHGNETAGIAREALEASFVINMPKIKTHAENGMSVCLKNMIGCLVGQVNKKKVHDNLPENILNIHRAAAPHLHIVDGLVAMEGLGPGKGTPIRLDTVIAGTDPFLIDLACARLADFDYRAVRTLKLAETKGLLAPEHHEAVSELNLAPHKKAFKPPKPGPLAAFIHHPKRQKFFLAIRYSRIFSYLASTDWFGRLLFLTNLRQDVFLQEEMELDSLTIDSRICTDCGICASACPVGLDLPDAFASPMHDCIHCLYCWCLCPEKAISFTGKAGFFQEQINQYDFLLRRLYTDMEKRKKNDSPDGS